MKANEFLTELFDKPIDYHWKNDGVAEFDVGNYHFIAKFAGDQDFTHFEFYLQDLNGNLRQDLANIFKNTGESLAVFSTITNIVLTYLQKHQPDVFAFGADGDEPSRVKLYDRLAQRIGNKFPYIFERKHLKKVNAYSYRFTKNEM